MKLMIKGILQAGLITEMNLLPNEGEPAPAFTQGAVLPNIPTKVIQLVGNNSMQTSQSVYGSPGYE